MKRRPLAKNVLTGIALSTLVLQPIQTNAGAFVFAGESNGVDLVAHPIGYSGSGGVVTVNVCIVPGTPNASLMEVSVANAVNTWNKLVPRQPNLFLGADNDLGSNEVDFESTVLHEIGHCIGSAHPNAATESGLAGDDRNYTKATDGADNVLNIDAGVDGLRGSADDIRGDDVNLHWFHTSTNSPLAIPPITDSSNYARPVALLPSGDNFAANADRDVLAALGAPNTEASMQQGAFSDEVQRQLVADDITTRKLAMSGLDRLQGTSDDYTHNLVYQGISSASSCNLNVSFDDTETGFAVCRTGGTFLDANNAAITSANTFYNTGFNWFFSDVPNSTVARADLNPPGLSVGDRNGSSVDIDGNFAVSGVRLDDHSGFTNAGSVFIHRREPGDIWVVEKQLFGPTDSGSDQDKFGHSVAISGDLIAVGAENDDDSGFRAGRVYLFGRNVGGADNWGLITSVVGNDTVERDFFGRSVSLDGDTLLVGAHNSDDAVGANTGAAYVFERNQGGADAWGQTQKLQASDRAPGDRFGIDVAIEGSHMVVGAHRKTVGGAANTGAAYFFVKTGTWLQTDMQQGEAAGDQFGRSVDLDAGRAVVGAWLGDSMAGNQTGAAYIYKIDLGLLWPLEQKVFRPTQVAGDRFGASVAISGERLLIGAPNEDSAGSNAGLAYSWEFNGAVWQDAGPVSNPGVSTRDEFGSAVALDSVFGVIGAPLDNQPTNAFNNSGGAYLEIQ